jgi:colicin import membrane protein
VSEQAKHLEAIWIERERKQRRQIDPADPTATIGTAASEATKECRLDLQHEFRLVSIRDRLGPGPMTDAEAESARLKKEAADKLEAERKAAEAHAAKLKAQADAKLKAEREQREALERAERERKAKEG